VLSHKFIYLTELFSGYFAMLSSDQRLSPRAVVDTGVGQFEKPTTETLMNLQSTQFTGAVATTVCSTKYNIIHLHQ